VTALARESQHELTATARIFNNVLLFGVLVVSEQSRVRARNDAHAL
jgi:hypothetical protein